MPKVIMICGKICSGKTTYANKIKSTNHAVILSVDEIMLALFGQNVDGEYVSKVKSYLYKKSLGILEAGINVVLDWGFWTHDERKFAKKFYMSRGIANEFHYIKISHGEWQNRISKRSNQNENSDAYQVSNELITKSKNIFEEPDKSEVDVWVKN